MKFLIVSPIPTDPVDAGNRARLAALIDRLRDWGHEVHLAVPPFEPCDPAAMRLRLGAPERLHALSDTPPPALSALVDRYLRKVGRVLRIDRAFMWTIDAWYQPAWQRELQALHSTHRYDAVIAEYVFMSRALEAFGPPVLKLLDTHDCFTMRHRRFLDAGLRARWFSTSAEQEAIALRRAHAVLAIQSAEADYFRSLLGPDARTSVETVGHFLQVQDAPVEPLHVEAATFVASDHVINVGGARHFIERVLPRIRERLPGFQLYVAGTVADRLDDRPGIVRLGFQRELREAFRQAPIGINPVQTGTGVNIKLLESLAHGVPVVSTRMGARGLEAYAGSGLAIVESEQAFADSVVQWVARPDERQRQQLGAIAAATRWNDEQFAGLRNALAASDSSCSRSLQRVPAPGAAEMDQRIAIGIRTH